ncbi:hypothetical protein [uncultured Litoreibacter sp.]|uniref:hypothetical protein n=1 Tax=uncultured Litoreibacter sp. TaxID=1392394 RepID=UPI00261687F8|nr:hypothetical protein [uncultured Litoreibacter sp.]
MAFFKGSYYETTAIFEAPEDGTRGFRGLRGRAIANPEPILEHGVNVGDRLDQLGQEYYANPRDWRRLADCNADVLFPEDLIYGPDGHPDQRSVAAEKTGRLMLVPRRREVR